MKPIAYPIRFKFDLNKFTACVAYFARQDLPDLDKLKICKLLYYADKEHLIKYGKPVLGDTYIHMDNGPVPSKSLDIFNDVIADDKVYSMAGEPSNKDYFKKFLKVDKGFLRHRFPVFQLVKDPGLDCLSESEQEALNETLGKYGHYRPGKLIELTHRDAAWKESSMNSEIDYRLFFEEEPHARPEALEYMESMRENYELMFGLE